MPPTRPSMPWWQWKRAEKALHTWVRSLIGERPYTITFKEGAGSYVNFATREIVVEPTMPASIVRGGAPPLTLPRTWRRQRVTTLAGLEWRMARALARHEAAHVLFTQPSPRDREGIVHWLANSLEDGRIERYLSALYPWCWGDFVELGLIVWQSFQLPEAPQDRLIAACLLHRWDVLRPKKAAARVMFDDPATRELWDARVRSLVEEAWAASESERVVEIAIEILKLAGVPEDRAASAMGMPRNPLDAAPTGKRDGDDQPITSPVVPGTAMPGADDLVSEEVDRAGGGDPPGVDFDLTRGHMFMQPYREIEREVGGAVRRLIAELAPPTPLTAPRPHMAKGTFSAREHVRSQGEWPMLHRRDASRSPEGLAMVLLIDRTGSMGNSDFDSFDVPAPGFFSPTERMYHARRAAMLLALACGAARIPLCIGYAGNEVAPRHGSLAGRCSVHLPESVVWIRDWDTPSDTEGQYAIIAGMYGDAGNAERVSESLRLAKARLRSRREKTKLIVYCHDGEPTDERPEQVRQSVEDARRDGTIVIGLFVGSQGEYHKLAAIFGDEHTIGVPDLTKLPERLGAILRRYYLQS
jgi:hypothetical protein